jgi:pyruvate formate lyase activating enzyme
MEIKGFIETSFVDWPGKICSVVFFPKCNFRCPYCHNPDLVLRPNHLSSIPGDIIIKRLSELKGWVDGVCLSGGEPTIQEDLERFIIEIHKMGFLVKLDTNGTNPEVLHNWIREGLLDSVSMDIKAPLEESIYSRLAGIIVDIKTIERSIKILLSSSIEVEFRTTFVPSLLRREDIITIVKTLNGFQRYTLQNFNPKRTIDPRLREYTPLLPSEFKELCEFIRNYPLLNEKIEGKPFQL